MTTARSLLVLPALLGLSSWALCEESASQLSKPEQEHLSPIDIRMRQQERTENKDFVITPLDRNYILPVSYKSKPYVRPYERFDIKNRDLDNVEVKFQISIAIPLMQDIWGMADLKAGYTMTAWWQAYNRDISSPFRETNHQPEALLSFPMNKPALGAHLRMIDTGIVHQSNGQTGELSRSWNRIYMEFVFEKDNFAWAIKPWYRIPEDKKEAPDDLKGDDNPDIWKYMGYGELLASYKWGEHNFGMLFRNNLRSWDKNKGAVQLDWSFPFWGRLRGYVQYFNGYGESLIDYNASSNRISLGILLTDWL
ncbi:phospholipase A [Parendozoicomonas sp. Alg238-R29]|uniref:phospholipase A n=1 Tax=Parendozoicomonas sp. Alg238-R29 TaxID=2993446 RepID=UPI00248DE555|nr:phospholipase A [Parendozoicomonas sp. Alg238-R29]